MNSKQLAEIDARLLDLNVQAAKLGRNILELVELKTKVSTTEEMTNVRLLLKRAEKEQILLGTIIHEHATLITNIREYTNIIRKNVIDNPNIDAQLAEIFGGR
jgi:signal transduction histidine kinase